MSMHGSLQIISYRYQSCWGSRYRVYLVISTRGLLPKELELWAVANPLTEASEAGVERVRRKVELGADAILTQPPLAWEPFER